MTSGQFEITAVSFRPSDLTLTWKNAQQHTRSTAYSSLWLRDNTPVTRDACTGQRLAGVTALPPRPLLTAAELEATGHIRVSWEDGEGSLFPSAFFREFERDRRIHSRLAQLPWLKQPATNFAWSAYADWSKSRQVRARWLHSLARDGMAFLRGVPEQKGAVLEAAAHIGFVRETNLGRAFDVESGAGPRLHTADPYRDPVPGFQMMHCLAVEGRGGESLFIDGLAVTERLRLHDPVSFALLAQTPVRFRLQNAAVDLAADRTMIEVDVHEQFHAIHYDDRSIAPLTLRGPALAKFYAAYRHLGTQLNEPARSVNYQLQPGELVILDNTRILHSLAEDPPLQACYIDADGIYSSLATLSRRTK
jgi:alpha-ketoglutarate-dependent taurine dioxygenase